MWKESSIPYTTLQCTLSESGLYKKSNKAEATTHFEGKSSRYDNQINEQHGHDTDICQLVQADIPTLGVQTQAEIQPVIVNEIISSHSNHIFPVPHEPTNATLEDPFTTGLLENNLILLYLHTAVFNSVEEPLSDKLGYEFIRWATW